MSLNPKTTAKADQTFASVHEALWIEVNRVIAELEDKKDPTQITLELALDYFQNMDPVLATGMLAQAVVEMSQGIHEGDWA